VLLLYSFIFNGKKICQLIRVQPNQQQASIDPKAFPDPLEIKLDRPLDSYIHFGHGSHACLGSKIVMTAMAAQLRVFGRLKGLRRIPGLAGQMKSKDLESGLKVYMTEDWREYWPFPTSKLSRLYTYTPVCRLYIDEKVRSEERRK